MQISRCFSKNLRIVLEFYGFCSGHWGNYFDPVLERNGKIVKGKGFITDDLTNQGIEFIKKNAKWFKGFAPKKFKFII